MAKGGGGGAQGQDEGSMGLLWIIAACLIFGYLMWSIFKVQLIHGYFKIKLWEIDFISIFTQRLQDVQYDPLLP